MGSALRDGLPARQRPLDSHEMLGAAMHELALCRSIFGIVDRARGDERVETVHVRVGQLRQVVPGTLEHCWRLVTETTPLEGSRLEIDHVSVQLWCSACSLARPAADPPRFACERCGSDQVAITGGTELLVTTVDVRRGDGGSGDG